MQQQRRDQYLRVLGITPYLRRQCPSDASTDAADPVSTPATDKLQQLRQTVADCTGCALCKTRTQTVFGVGRVSVACMLIGEGPGAEEDRQGEPFVGRAGQLLNRMLAAIGLSRSQVYITNIVKCRPPGNRNPLTEEIAACQGYLSLQIALVRPRVIVALGRVAAQHLARTTDSIKHLRLHQHRCLDSDIPLLVTYHPAYLLRNPIDKRKAFDDLKRLRNLLVGG